MFDWIRLDQIGSNWIRVDQIGSEWIKLDQIGLKNHKRLQSQRLQCLIALLIHFNME